MGVVVAIGRAPEPGGRDAALRWWDDVHVPDLLAVDGVLAVLRFAPARGIDDDLVLHLVLLEADPEVVMAAHRRCAAVRTRRSGASRPTAACTSRSRSCPTGASCPLEYDFEF